MARWIADGEILIAPAVALSLAFPTQMPVLTGVGLVVLVCAWLVRWRVQRYPLRCTPLNLALLLLLATVPVAVWASAVRDRTTEALAYLLAGVVIFSAVVNWTHAFSRSRNLFVVGASAPQKRTKARTTNSNREALTLERVWWTWGGLVAVGLTLVALAPLGMEIRSGLFAPPAVYTRWAGRFPETINPNILAGALVALWPIPLAGIQLRPVQHATPSTRHVIRNTSPVSRPPSHVSRFTSRVSRLTSRVSRFTPHVLRLAATLSALLLLATLALTQSRGAYMGFAVGALVLLSLHWPKVALVVVPLAVTVAIAGVGLVGWRTVADELMTGEATSGLDQRTEIWSRAVYAIQDFPFTGLGLGTFEQVVAVLYPLLLNPVGTVPHAHNLYLQVAVDLGLPGLVAYLALLGLTFANGFSAYRAFRQRGQSALAGLCTGCIAGLAGVCIHGLVDAAAWGVKLTFVPWAVMGLVVGLQGLAEGELGCCLDAPFTIDG